MGVFTQNSNKQMAWPLSFLPARTHANDVKEMAGRWFIFHLGWAKDGE